MHRVLYEAIAELEAAGLVEPGKPRHRPLYVAQVGLFDRPTLVSICSLGQAAPNPVLGLLKDFREPLAAQNVIVQG